LIFDGKNMVILTDQKLREVGKEIFKAAGASEDEAEWVTDCLVLSNLKGVDSHGVRHIPGYVRAIQRGDIELGAQLSLVKEMPATLFYDGGGGFGYTIARDAMNATIKKAKNSGMVYCGVRNLHHIGRVGKWPEMALDDDMIGIASQPGGVYIAPWGGIERKLPIAPIAISIPTGEYPPIVIDMSLGPLAGGRNAILALRNKEVPSGWLIDNEGKPTTDPSIFHKGEGAQMPLGQTGLGYKGTALAMIIDVFAGPLLGYFTTIAHPFKRRGVFFGAINLEAFTDVDEFKNNMDEVIRDIKSSKKAEGFDEIMIPGEPEWRELEKRSKEGIFIDDDTYQEILKTAEEMGLDTSKYKGKPGKLKITHPSYTLRQRYK
jgi:uncharacterized oxidoreductase